MPDEEMELDTGELEDTGEEGIEDTGAQGVEDEGGEEDPWAWAADADPSEVKKTYQDFTQTRQSLAERRKEVESMRDELAPLSRLRDTLAEDPGLVQVIEKYFADGPTSEDEISQVRNELNSVKTSIQIEKDLAAVGSWVRENNLPAFDEQELLNHASENRILNLKAAYRDMNFDKIQDRKADQLADDIKRGKGAALPKTRRADTGGKGSFSEDDIAAMSDDEFKKNFSEIFDSFG